MLFRLSFVTLLLALLVLGTPVKRDAAQVESDMKTLNTKSQTLDTSINAFPNSGATIGDAMAVHENAVSLVSSINTATNDVKATDAFTESQATSIMEVIKSLALFVQQVCSDLKAKKTAIKGVNAQGIAESDLKTTKEAMDPLGTQFMLKLPKDMQSSSQQQFNDADEALISAINAFA